MATFAANPADCRARREEHNLLHVLNHGPQGSRKSAGVIDARVDYDHKTATVKYDPEKASPAAFVKATTNAGVPSMLHNGTQK
jgi:hypothetical protein